MLQLNTTENQPHQPNKQPTNFHFLIYIYVKIKKKQISTKTYDYLTAAYCHQQEGSESKSSIPHAAQEAAQEPLSVFKRLCLCLDAHCHT